MVFVANSISRQALEDVPDRDVQSIELVHLGYCPCSLLPMPAHHRPLMAVVAQRYGGVLLALVDVMG